MSTRLRILPLFALLVMAGLGPLVQAKPPELPLNEKDLCKEGPVVPPHEDVVIPAGASEPVVVSDAPPPCPVAMPIDGIFPCFVDWLALWVDRLARRGSRCLRRPAAAQVILRSGR